MKTLSNIKKTKEQEIINVVAEYHMVSPKEVLNGRRFRQLVSSRQMITSLLIDILGYTFEQVRDTLNYSNHSSGIHSLKMHKVDYQSDDMYKSVYIKLLKQLDNIDIDNEEEDVIKANIILKRRLSEFESKYKEKVEEGRRLQLELKEIKGSMFYIGDN